MMGSDNKIATLVYDLNDYIQDKALHYDSEVFWQSLYGGPHGRSGDNTDLMNSDPHQASHWKGRVLMQIEREKQFVPKSKDNSKTSGPEIKECHIDTDALENA